MVRKTYVCGSGFDLITPEKSC